MTTTNKLSRPCLRVLFALLRLTQRGERPVLRDVMLECGFKSPVSVLIAARHLRAAGLVNFEDGRARTLRPTCRMVVYERGGE